MSAQLRVEESFEEIMTTLKKMQREKSLVVIWQKPEGNTGDRKVFNSYIKNIDKTKKTLYLVALDDTTEISIDENTTIYIRGDERSILFKQSKVTLKKGHLSLLIPTEVRVFERRYTERIDFDMDEEFSIELKNIVKKLSNTIFVT